MKIHSLVNQKKKDKGRVLVSTGDWVFVLHILTQVQYPTPYMAT